MMDVEQSLYQDEVARPRRRLEHPGQAVRRQVRPARAAEVEIARVLRVCVEGARPERLDPAALVAPRAAEAAGPARVGEDPRSLDLLGRVAGRAKAVAGRGGLRHDAESAPLDR